MSGAADRARPDGRGPDRAAGSAVAWVVLVATLALGLGVDLWSKHAAFRSVAADPVAVSREAVLETPPDRLNQALIPAHEPVTVVPYALEFRLLLNPGAVFGVGPGKRWFFIAFTAAAVALALWMFARWTSARDRWSHVAIGLVLAGGFGNLYDRLAYGCVRDFLHPLPNVHLPFGLAWPSGETEVWPWVSNVADALLLVGIGILLVRIWVSGKREEGAKGGAEADRAEPSG